MRLGESVFPYSSRKLMDRLLLTTYLSSLQEVLKSGLDPKKVKSDTVCFLNKFIRAIKKIKSTDGIEICRSVKL